MHLCNQKSKLITGVKVKVSARTVGKPGAFFLDGCALLWIVALPSKVSIGSLVDNFRKYVTDKLKITDVDLTFDQYYDDSIKGLTRFNRDTGASRVYHLILNTPIQCKDVILKMSENKEQLIRLIYDDVVANAMLIFPHKFIVNGEDSVPLQTFKGHISRCENLRKTREEAETITIHHLVVSAPTKAIIVADNSDIFVLLLNFIFTGDIKSQVYMQTTDKDNSYDFKMIRRILI